MATDFVQVIKDAQEDALSLSNFVFQTAGYQVERRLAPPINTLQYYLDYLEGLEKVYSQESGFVDVNGEVVKTVRQSVNDSIDSALLGEYQSQVQQDLVSEVNRATQAEQAILDSVDALPFVDNLLPVNYVTTAPIVSGANKRTQLDKNRERITILDFFFPDELAAYRLSPTTFDAHRPVQAFFDYIVANEVHIADPTGTFYTSKGITFGTVGTSATKTLRGDFALRALAPIDTLFHIQSGTIRWWGIITATGLGSQSFSSRTCGTGIRIGGDYGAPRSIFGGLIASYFHAYGVLVDDLTTLTNLGDMRTNDCGSGSTRSGWSLTGTFTNRVDTGRSGLNDQLSTVTVSALPPDTVTGYKFILIDGQYHYIDSIDTVNSTISVHPWIDLNKQTGDFTYVFGAGVYFRGSDTSCLTVNSMDLKRCGVGMHTTSLYAPEVGTVVNQYCGVGLLLGAYKQKAHIGGYIGQMYSENNNCDILRASISSGMRFVIDNTLALSYGKIKFTTYARTSNNGMAYGGSISNIVINNQDVVRAPNNYVGSTRSLNLALPSEATTFFTTRGSVTINIADISQVLNDLYGKDYIHFSVFGDKDGENSVGAPTGTITINAPTGYTFQGGVSTLTFSEFEAVPIFAVQVFHTAKEIKLSLLNPKYVPPVEDSVTETFTDIVRPVLEAGETKATTVVFDGYRLTTHYLSYLVIAGASTEIAITIAPRINGSIYVLFTNLGTTQLAAGTVTLKVTRTS